MDNKQQASHAVKRLDRLVVKQIVDEVNKAMEDVAEKFGLAFERKKGTFSDIQFSGRFQFNVLADGGVSVKSKNDFDLYASRFGLSPEMFGKEYQQGPHTFKIVGLNVRSPKNCVRLERSDGAEYKCSAEYAKLMLGIPRPSFGSH